MLVTFIRTIVLYVVVIISLRIMGKRQIGELQPSELVITILISNIATLPIEDTNIPLLGGLVPILALVCLEVFASVLGIKSQRARKLISGTPAFVIKNGVIDQKRLRDLRFSTDDLMEGLREQNIFDIRDVDYAIVETTGKLSVYKVFEQQEVTAKMLKISSQSATPSPQVTVVSDGKLIKDGIDYCNIDKSFIESALKKQGCSIKDVFIMTCDRSKDYHIVKKEV